MAHRLNFPPRLPAKTSCFSSLLTAKSVMSKVRKNCSAAGLGNENIKHLLSFPEIGEGRDRPPLPLFSPASSRRFQLMQKTFLPDGRSEEHTSELQSRENLV